ncbi:MAG: histidine phosphatase family protein, partial [Synechococcales bacterium]|nr:histidine phosphatase family protein [Synechococcales bacterium]
MPNTQIILVRHGQSTYNAQKRYQGSCDRSDLTEIGDREAILAGQMLANRMGTQTVDVVYSSPLKRALQTAQTLVNQLDLPSLLPIAQDDLREIDLPGWAGLPFQQVQTEFPEAYRCWQEQPQNFQMTVATKSLSSTVPIAVMEPQSITTFPVRDLYQRAQHFWRNLLHDHKGERILTVSHGGTIRALVSTALGIMPDKFHYLQQSNCGITTLEFDEWGQASLLDMNVETHTGKTLPKLKNGKQGIRLLLVPTD